MNVVSIAAPSPPSAEELERAARDARMPMPVHFRNKGVKAAWRDLVDSVELALLTRDNRFTLEFAALLTAKMRSGKPMTATESKELKRYLVTLGLAKGEDGRPPESKRKTGRFFDEPPR